MNGSLPAEERDLVEQHVRSCLSCHRELKEQQRLRAALRSQPAIHISAQSGFEKLTRDLGGTPRAGREPHAAVRRVHALRRRCAPPASRCSARCLWLVPRCGSDRYAPTFETLATQPAATPRPRST